MDPYFLLVFNELRCPSVSSSYTTAPVLNNPKAKVEIINKTINKTLSEQNRNVPN